jgi:hypothetical protein
MSRTGTREDREKMLCKHLPYEIEMLRFAHKMLQEPHHDKMIANSLIECFCIHARNLIDFFYEDKPDNAKDAVARHFTDRSSYCPFAGKSPKEPGALGRLYAKVNKQITHITYDRTDIDTEKIGPEDRRDLRDLIENEINNFRDHIRTPYTKYAYLYNGDFASNKWPLSPNAPTSSQSVMSGTSYGPPAPPSGNYRYIIGRNQS